MVIDSSDYGESESTILYSKIRANYEQTGPTNYQTVNQENAYDSVTLVSVGFGTLQGMGVATLLDAKNMLTDVLAEIENVGHQLGTIGANLTLIEETHNMAGDRVAAGQVALARQSEGEFPESSLELAMSQIKAQGNVALLTQAKEMSKSIYNLLW